MSDASAPPSSSVPAAVPGFRVASGACGIKRRGEPDLALVASDRPAVVAGLFTTNRIQAAPVVYDRAILERPGGARVRAVVANAGCANACTGPEGLEDARRSAWRAAGRLGCRPEEVLVLSTGVIGERLPMDRLLPGIDGLATELSPDGWNGAARAIMTTDTRPKLAAREVGDGTILGIAKGAGMISPRMATMLAVIATDLTFEANQAAEALRRAADESFHRIVVDGDMSTNDTVLLLANGARAFVAPPPAADVEAALTDLCRELARSIVADGEGASKVVRIEVTGASDERQAETVARAVALSPLCKTAFYAEDPNWGRILSAAGASGVPLDPERLRLTFGPDESEQDVPPVEIATEGRAAPFSEAAARAIMERPAWTLHLDLGLGDAASWVWTCDLSTEYVTINGGYRT